MRGNRRGAILAGPWLLYAVTELAGLIWQGLGPGGHQTLWYRSPEVSEELDWKWPGACKWLGSGSA